MGINTCHDCGCKEGEYHISGYDMERCPFCGKQLISCNCCYERLGFTIDRDHPTMGLPEDIYENGLTPELEKQWDSILRRMELVPYIVYPIICAHCGELWPDLFMVPDIEWKHYVEPAMRGKVLCRACYDEIKRLIDEAGNGLGGIG